MPLRGPARTMMTATLENADRRRAALQEDHQKNAPMPTAAAAIGNQGIQVDARSAGRFRAARSHATRTAQNAGEPQLEKKTMPKWITNELTIAGPRGPIVDALDAELWDQERAARDGNGLVLHIAVPAVPSDTESDPSYPGGKFGEEAWGCRAVSRSGPHERNPTRSTWGWLEAHPYLFYFGLEDFVYRQLGGLKACVGSLAERRDMIDEAATGRAAPAAIEYRFDTAYRPPKGFLQKLRRRYPHLYLRLMWQGEEPKQHGMVVHAPQPPGWPVDTQPTMPPHSVLDPELAEAARRTPPPYAASRDIRQRTGVQNASAP